MKHLVNILSISNETHDVACVKTEKPYNYSFLPGQAVSLEVDDVNYRNKERPFTITSIPSDSYLEFYIKRYDSPTGITPQIHKLASGEKLLISDPWGAIQYKGRGYFIAGGTGITPFISIFRNLKYHNQAEGNKLFFSNKTEADIICKNELSALLGNNATFFLTEENSSYKECLDEAFLKANVKQKEEYCYVCGPNTMVDEMSSILKTIGVNPDKIIIEL